MVSPMLTLGIDLSADDRRTAACTIAWHDGRGEVRPPETGLDDLALRERIAGVLAGGGWAGIDAPFSWPVSFREALAGHDRDGGWPADWRHPRHQFRATDLFVAACARRPLSVSTNLIGVTAMRAARVLQEVGDERGRRLDIAGADRVVEVYPAGSLVAWGGPALGLDPRGYKNGPGAPARRGALVAALCDRDWLAIDRAAREACERSDHVLDALVAALATRAAARGLTRPPLTAEQRALAPVEGWIHVPVPETLDELAGSGP
jgi:predicted nuclease with RNAse H fold